MKAKSKKKNVVQEHLEYALFRTLLFPVRVVSRKRLDRWAGRFARTAQRLLPKRNAAVLRNLEAVFPEKSAAEREAIADACWRHFASIVLHFLHGTRKNLDESTGEVIFEGEAQLARAKAAGNGVVLVTAHFGDWERGISMLSLLPPPITVVARDLDNRLLDRDLFRARIRADVEIIDRRRAARALIRTLEKKGTVAVLPDQAVKPREGILVPFLGRPAWTTPAPARLAARSGAPILCAYLITEGDDLRVVLDEPMFATGEDDAAIEELTRRMNDSISAQIRKRPELWLWMHERWKGTEKR